jgi:hypothetical protein
MSTTPFTTPQAPVQHMEDTALRASDNAPLGEVIHAQHRDLAGPGIR